MTAADRLARADRAKAELEFIGPAFDYIERLKIENLVKAANSSDPRAREVIERLSAQIQAVRTVRAEIEAIVADGSLAEKDLAQDAKLARLSDHKRSVIGA